MPDRLLLGGMFRHYRNRKVDFRKSLALFWNHRSLSGKSTPACAVTAPGAAGRSVSRLHSLGITFCSREGRSTYTGMACIARSTSVGFLHYFRIISLLTPLLKQASGFVPVAPGLIAENPDMRFGRIEHVRRWLHRPASGGTPVYEHPAPWA